MQRLLEIQLVIVVGAVCDSAEDGTRGLGHAREALYSELIDPSNSMSLMSQEISSPYIKLCRLFSHFFSKHSKKFGFTLVCLKKEDFFRI